MNISTNEKTIFPTVRQAASELGVSHVTLIRVLKSEKLLKATYKISYLRKS